jgi:hypothetical protein
VSEHVYEVSAQDYVQVEYPTARIVFDQDKQVFRVKANGCELGDGCASQTDAWKSAAERLRASRTVAHAT